MVEYDLVLILFIYLKIFVVSRPLDSTTVPKHNYIEFSHVNSFARCSNWEYLNGSNETVWDQSAYHFVSYKLNICFTIFLNENEVAAGDHKIK